MAGLYPPPTSCESDYPVGETNVLTTFHENNFVPVPPVDTEMFHWISENFDLLVALQKKSEGFILRGPWMSLNFMVIQPVVVEIPKRWTEWHGIAIPRATAPVKSVSQFN